MDKAKKRNLQDQFQKIQILLEEWRLTWVPIHADGNCLFSALASFFGQKEIDHGYLRKEVVNHIQGQPLTFETDILANDYPDVATYCNRMAKLRYWGDAIALQAFCQLSQLNIWLLTPAGVCQISDYGNDKDNIALIHWGNHYDATTPIEEKGPTAVGTLEVLIDQLSLKEPAEKDAKT